MRSAVVLSQWRRWAVLAIVCALLSGRSADAIGVGGEAQHTLETHTVADVVFLAKSSNSASKSITLPCDFPTNSNKLQYDAPAAGNASDATPGLKQLVGWLRHNWAGKSEGYGLAWRSTAFGTPSLHARGMANDWDLRADKPEELLVANALMWFLTKNGGHNARVMGVSEVIWNRKRWGATAPTKFEAYNSGDPHIGHVHIGLNNWGSQNFKYSVPKSTPPAKQMTADAKEAAKSKGGWQQPASCGGAKGGPTLSSAPESVSSANATATGSSWGNSTTNGTSAATAKKSKSASASSSSVTVKLPASAPKSCIPKASPAAKSKGTKTKIPDSKDPFVWGESCRQDILKSGKKFSDVSGLLSKPGTCASLAGNFGQDKLCFDGYEVVTTRIQPGMVAAANFLLKTTSTEHFGDHFTFSVGASQFMARVEYHCHNPGERGPQGWHRGITIFNKKQQKK